MNVHGMKALVGRRLRLRKAPSRAECRARLLRAESAFVFAFAALVAHTASAQSFPSKPVRIVVPLSPGGNVDLVTRSLAPKLTEQLGQQVLVDNRPGGNTVIGTELVARSAPDGHTVLAASNTFVATPGLVPKIPYDPVRDFAGVSLIARLPQALVVHPSLPARTVKDLIALAKKRPGEIVHATQGEASTGRIAAELFTQKTGARFMHVPYKGGGQAIIDLLGGQASMMFATVSTALPHVKAGRIRALGLTSKERSPVFPGVPTIAEAGVPGYEASIFNLIAAPAATPREIRARLQSEIARAVAAADLKARFVDQGVELVGSASPEECSALIKAEFEKHTQLWKTLGLSVSGRS
jgi:tripartite-type tricarboxylate transporter receptor subunit TctC